MTMTKEEVVETLSDIRAGYNLFDEDEASKYHSLSVAIQAIKAEPIKHAKWEQDLFGTLWVCSACNMPTDVKSAPKYFKYCPYCGAKVESEVEK